MEKEEWQDRLFHLVFNNQLRNNNIMSGGGGGGGVNYGRVVGVMVVVSVVSASLQCVEEFDLAGGSHSSTLRQWWLASECVFAAVFGFELVVRVWCRELLRTRGGHNIWTSSELYIDVITLLPLFMGADSYDDADGDVCDYFGSGGELRLRDARSLRLLRILKLSDHFPTAKIIQDTIQESVKGLIVTLYLVLLLYTVFGGILFYIERGHRTLVFDNNSTDIYPYTADILTPEQVRKS